MPGSPLHIASAALPGALLAPGQPALPHKLQKTFTQAESQQRFGELWVVDSQSQLVLQTLLGGSQESVGMRQEVAGCSILRVLGKVVTNWAQDLNLL